MGSAVGGMAMLKCLPPIRVCKRYIMKTKRVQPTYKDGEIGNHSREKEKTHSCTRFAVGCNQLTICLWYTVKSVTRTIATPAMT